jgi:hypothetical protein
LVWNVAEGFSDASRFTASDLYLWVTTDERAQAASIAAIRTAESSRTVFRALGTVTPCLCYA